MILKILAGLWICIAALGTSFGVLQWKTSASDQSVASTEKKNVPEMRRMKPITVPLIANGSVQGYLIAQLAFLADGDALKSIPVQPDSFVHDEAFRLLYGDEKLDYRHLERFDLAAFAVAVRKGVQARLKSDVILDVLVQEFNFIGVEDIRR